YSYVVQAFLLAYTLSYIAAGRITDWLGTRASMVVFIVWWSLADMLTSLSRGVRSLGFFRLLLGMGEPGNYTAAPKAVSEWFPAKERALVIGIYTAGATLGATVAPPVVAYLASQFNWRTVFSVHRQPWADLGDSVAAGLPQAGGRRPGGARKRGSRS